MTTFNWRKGGIIFAPNLSHDWMYSHAQVPYTLVFDDRIRAYFSTRKKMDAQGQYVSQSGYVDFSRTKFPQILHVSSTPILKLGDTGEFDEFGSMAGSVIRHEDKYYLYYCGWSRGYSVPYTWAIGLAVSEDGVNFRKEGKGPLLGPTLREPYLQACPIVYKIAENNWLMFYLSGIKWIKQNGKLDSQYVLMRAWSSDGINWVRESETIIPPMVEDECQTSASIIQRNGIYHMFFSYRHGTRFRNEKSRGYRIGYASSPDLVTWTRDDGVAGLEPSSSGWDSEMVAYPHLFSIGGRLIMLYCGNDFGKAGFGFAEMDGCNLSVGSCGVLCDPCTNYSY
jgi:predicted GH43/DUF377 family glycosyl hydrolase